MKKAVVFIYSMLMIASLDALSQTFLDLGKCNLKIVEVHEIQSFKGEKGEVKASRRDAKLLEVKVEGVAYSDGVSAWYPQMFAALFNHRGASRITPALALGIKFTNPQNGENVAQWFNAPGVSFTAKHKAGDTVKTYLIIEIAKETNDFILQGPAVIALDK
jgi:hypothetical protein